MKILMLGWEYPPHIAGGLGTACEGLTRGLARLGIDVTFVVPRLHGGEDAGHMTLTDPYQGGRSWTELEYGDISWDEEHLQRLGIEAFLMPYWTEIEYKERLESVRHAASVLTGANVHVEPPPVAPSGRAHYGRDIFDEVARYARNTVARVAGLEFDVIHAHDWMTYPAGIALAELTGKPLVAHVHSLEYDRSGTHVNQRIHQVERAGLHRANAVIAVSHYTKSVIHREHGVPLDKIHAVHNGIYPARAIEQYRAGHPEAPQHKVVLFLGRITFQKGPDYFVRAAAKVVPHVPGVVFVMAGSGDMKGRMMELAETLGILEHFEFPGFLRGKEVEEMYNLADLYVMPSVSEPFGISALEAINFDVPTLISKQSGVAEVVGNSLKFDFWDVDRLADLMINGLIHEELRADMTAMAKLELKNVRWDASASKTLEVYSGILH